MPARSHAHCARSRGRKQYNTLPWKPQQVRQRLAGSVACDADAATAVPVKDTRSVSRTQLHKYMSSPCLAHPKTTAQQMNK